MKTELDILVSYKDDKGVRHHTNVYCQIPDDFVAEYARDKLELMTFEEAIDGYEPEPDERDEP